MSVKGFTFMECLVALAIIGVIMLGVVGTMTYFGSDTADKATKTCLLNQATSALTYRKATGSTPSTSFTCNNRTGTLSMTTTTVSGSTLCTDYTATATMSGKSVSLKTRICNF